MARPKENIPTKTDGPQSASAALRTAAELFAAKRLQPQPAEPKPASTPRTVISLEEQRRVDGNVLSASGKDSAPPPSNKRGRSRGMNTRKGTLAQEGTKVRAWIDARSSGLTGDALVAALHNGVVDQETKKDTTATGGNAVRLYRDAGVEFPIATGGKVYTEGRSSVTGKVGGSKKHDSSDPNPSDSTPPKTDEPEEPPTPARFPGLRFGKNDVVDPNRITTMHQGVRTTHENRRGFITPKPLTDLTRPGMSEGEIAILKGEKIPVKNTFDLSAGELAGFNNVANKSGFQPRFHVTAGEATVEVKFQFKGAESPIKELPTEQAKLLQVFFDLPVPPNPSFIALMDKFAEAGYQNPLPTLNMLNVALSTNWKIFLDPVNPHVIRPRFLKKETNEQPFPLTVSYIERAFISQWDLDHESPRARHARRNRYDARFFDGDPSRNLPPDPRIPMRLLELRGRKMAAEFTQLAGSSDQKLAPKFLSDVGVVNLNKRIEDEDLQVRVTARGLFLDHVLLGYKPEGTRTVAKPKTKTRETTPVEEEADITELDFSETPPDDSDLVE